MDALKIKSVSHCKLKGCNISFGNDKTQWLKSIEYSKIKITKSDVWVLIPESICRTGRFRYVFKLLLA